MIGTPLNQLPEALCQIQILFRQMTRLQHWKMKLYEMTLELNELRKQASAHEVSNYEFSTQAGSATLLDLFADRDKLLVIHNMGQSCRYCTLWGDGFNGLVDHLESAMSVVMVSKDEPELQRQFANSRGWRFRLASHGGGDYIKEQTVMDGSCLLYTSPSPRDQRGSRMPSSA